MNRDQELMQHLTDTIEKKEFYETHCPDCHAELEPDGSCTPCFVNSDDFNIITSKSKRPDTPDKANGPSVNVPGPGLLFGEGE